MTKFMRVLSMTLTILLALTACVSVKHSSIEQQYSSAFWSHRVNATYNLAYGELPKQKLDIYRQGSWQGPPEYFVPGKDLKPTLIYIHGGAWHGGAKEASLWSLMHYLQRGWNVVNVEYRAGGRTAPKGADDVLLAMNWLAEHAEQYAIDRNKVVVSGDSAGGHLALYAGLVDSSKLKVRAIVNWFGIPDIKRLDAYLSANESWNYPRLWAGSDNMFNRLVNEYSPINFVDENSPAIISIHGTADKVVPIEQSEILHLKLSGYQLPNKLIRLDGGRHLGFTDVQFQTIYREIFAFLDSLEIG